MDFITVPSILFLVIVAPLWLIMHYRYKSRMAQGISEQDLHNIEDMLEKVDKLSTRIEALESILDQRHEDWNTSKREQERR